MYSDIALSLWFNMVCGGLEQLLVYSPGFNSQIGQVTWVKIASAYALRLISWTGKRV